jgi:hypothetical protein
MGTARQSMEEPDAERGMGMVPVCFNPLVGNPPAMSMQVEMVIAFVLVFV